jgi:chaperonin GroES
MAKVKATKTKASKTKASKTKASKTKASKTKANKPNVKASKPKSTSASKLKTAKAQVKAKPKTKAAVSKPRSSQGKTVPVKLKAKAKPATSKPVARGAINKAPSQSSQAPKLRLVSSSAGTLSKNFSPLDDRILVQVEARMERTPGGLYIPDTVSERPNVGRVVAVGPGKRSKKGKLQPLDVRVGDEVMFAQWGGLEIEMPGQSGRFLILRETDLLGVKA